MKIFYPLLALGVWLLLQSCDSKQEALKDASSSTSTLPLTLTLSDTIYLPLDESTSLSNRLGNSPFYLPEEDKTYFTHAPTSKNTIQVYDIEKASLDSEIPYQVTGPDGIKMPAYFGYYTPITKDSFFIGNYITNTYALINKEGKVLKRFRWQDKQHIDPFFKGIRHKQQLIFILTPDTHTLYQFNYNNSAPLKYDSLLLTLDLRTGERKKYFTWPKKYQKYNFLHASLHSMCRGPGDTLVLSLSASHELYLFDLNHLEAGPIGTVMAKSSMVKLTTKPKGMHPVDASYESSMYHGIIYDPYRKLYYRIGYTLPIKGQTLKTVNPGFQLPKKDVVVLTLDSRFNVIGEDRIDGALIFAMGFVTPQGLVFKENYLNQENAPQDAFRFFVFTPKKKE
jgi:hypothetical protein